jgi:PAS domain S-box-containing protein
VPVGGVFEALFGQSPIGVGVFDAECRYVTANPALQEIIGLPLDRLLGRRIDEVLGALGRDAAMKLRQAMADGSPLVNHVLSGATPGSGGEDRTFLASYFRLSDADGGLIGAASLVTDVTDQRRIRDELATANTRLALLAEVSDVLSSSLELDVTLAAFADLVVPTFADHCVVDLVDEDDPDRIRRVALVHAPGLAPAVEAWARPGEIVDYPYEHPAAKAMRTGRGVLEHADDTPDFHDIAPTPESAAYGRAIGIRSAMTAPLVARGEVLGAVSFVSSASGRTFTATDVEMGEELASRAAIAIDNARLYGREQRIALTLQRSLLPDRLAEIPGLETAAVYHPAARDGAVGGDWYDVIPLAGGRAGIVIGDVMGRGVPAAALMGQLRAAVRAYAAQDLAPATVLDLLDELVTGLAAETLVSCIYAVYDPAQGRLRLANAGHPPPLVVARRGARRLEAHGVLLGAGAGPFADHEVTLEPGAILALYTDGLVERRDEDLDARIAMLAQALSDDGRPLARMCAEVVASFIPPRGHDDDVALMLVRPSS